MKRNLVLGMASGYNWYALEPFVRSFAKNCPNDDLVLFVNDISDFTRSQLESVNSTQKLRGGDNKN